jgi:hypothetical protein
MIARPRCRRVPEQRNRQGVTVRIKDTMLSFFDHDTLELAWPVSRR